MEKFKQEEFITEAKNFFTFYKKRIGESIRESENIIYLSFNDLSGFSHQIAELLLDKPEEILSWLETALQEMGFTQKSPKIRLKDLPESSYVKIRNIRAKHLNKFIWVEGIVRQASDVRPQVVTAKFECPSCGTIISVLQLEKKFKEPSRCSCGRKGFFKLVSKQMVDAQRLVVEESPEALVGGEQPRRMNIFVKEDLVDPKMEERTTPGSKVKVLGILNEVSVPLPLGVSTRFDLAIDANNVIPLEESYDELKISEEDELQIKELSMDPNIYNRLSENIAPSIYGYDEVKKALVLQLFGGVKKSKLDGTVTRGDIHILLVGDPGVAKSVVLKFISKIAPKGRYVVGKSASGAGLTATVVRDEFLKGWSLEAGAMVLSNKGIVCIDEIEKMDPNDRSAMHEAMEQQCYLSDFNLTFSDGSKQKIGEFVDRAMEENKNNIIEGINCQILPLEINDKLLTTNFESIYPVKIDKVSRHLAPDKFVKINLANGREITVTPEHPCWTVKNGKIITLPAIKLSNKNDFPIVKRKKIQWIKVKSTEIIDNNGIKWVYDVTIEPTNAFISNNMVLHNSVTISKANVQASLRAETSVLAAGNPKFGRFDPYQAIASQIDIQPTLLNRFDVIFMLRDLPDKTKDEAIASHVLFEQQNSSLRGSIEPELFRKYIAYSKQRTQPKLSDEAVNEIKNFYVTLRNAPTQSDSPLKPIPITARQLEALVRLSEASAKTRLSLVVEKEDALRAVNLMKFYLMQAGYDYETKSFDIDKIVTGVTASKRGRIHEVRETIFKLESRIGKLIPIEEIEKELEGKIQKQDLDEAIEKLHSSGDLFIPKKGFIQRV